MTDDNYGCLPGPNNFRRIAAEMDDPYRDDTFEERKCDRCEKPYRGPAVYCSFACSIADSGIDPPAEEPTAPSSSANHQREAPEQFVNQTWQRRAARVPALERRYPPGCPDPDWCAGNNICYWECTRSFDVDSEEP